jgi:hypothetical protein
VTALGAAVVVVVEVLVELVVVVLVLLVAGTGVGAAGSLGWVAPGRATVEAALPHDAASAPSTRTNSAGRPARHPLRLTGRGRARPPVDRPWASSSLAPGPARVHGHGHPVTCCSR